MILKLLNVQSHSSHLLRASTFSKYKLSNMISMDETAVLMGQPSQITIDQTGATSIYVPSKGHESACDLAIRLHEKKTSSLIITKGSKEMIECISGI